MEKVEYGAWESFPKVAIRKGVFVAGTPIWKRMPTKYEGDVLYNKLWNFWVRAGAVADPGSDRIFRDFEVANADSDALLKDVGFPWKKAETEEEVWARIGMAWNWLRDHVVHDDQAYGTVSLVDGEWPSISDYARYYVQHGNLVWSACFSKAHLFATLLGRMIYPRFRFGIAEAHHTEDGAPPAATHDYVGVYVSDRWFYLDPTAVYSEAFPGFEQRKSVAVKAFTTVDYQHPYNFIPVPLSGLKDVPLFAGLRRLR